MEEEIERMEKIEQLIVELESIKERLYQLSSNPDDNYTSNFRDAYCSVEAAIDDLENVE